MTSSTPTDKPRLRGVFHLIALLATPLAIVALMTIASGPQEMRAVVVYGAGMASTFGVSAAYHVPSWSPNARSLWRRVDHAAIFALVYGTYVPICRVGLPAATGDRFLSLIGWACVGGAVLELAQPPLGRALRAGVFLLIGWSGVTLLPTMWESLASRDLVLFVSGGIVYSIGAIIYAIKRPNPIPGTLGHHEIFHALVIAGCLLQYLVVWNVIAHA